MTQQSTVDIGVPEPGPARAALRNQPGRAVVYMLAQAFLLTSMDGLVKWLASDYTVGQIAWLRYSLGLCMMIAFAASSSHGLGA